MKAFALGCLGFVVAPILLLIVVGTVAAARPTPPAAARQPETGLGAPMPIASWSGSGDKTTEPVALKGSRARLDIQLSRQVCIRVTRPDGTYVKSECPGQSGATYFYLRPGTYVFAFSTIGPWSATVTDLA